MSPDEEKLQLNRVFESLYPDFHYRNTDIQRLAMEVLSNYTNVALCGGAGSGKTFIALRAIVLRALRASMTDHLILRKELTAARASIWDQGLPEVLRVCFPGLEPHKNNKDSILTFPNGSRIRLGGASDRAKLEKILGQTQSTIYINEASEVMVDLFSFCQTRIRQKSILIPKIICDFNPPFKSHWTYHYFVEKRHKDKSPVADPENYGFLQMNPRDNTYLTEEYIKSLENLPPKMRKRFYLGEFTDDAEGALFKQKDINDHRVPYINYEHLFKNIPIGFTVVAIDPATSKTEDSDLTGIVAIGCGQQLRPDGREDIYVLADKSMRGSPYEWAQAAIDLAQKVKADLIVAEKNQGGDMVEAILRSTTLRGGGFRGKVELVHASKGKITRAEPIEALYEQGFVHHLNSKELSDLEDQMCSYVPHMLTGVDASPDRMDALVWGITYLTDNNNHSKHMRMLDPEQIKQAASRSAMQMRQINNRF